VVALELIKLKSEKIFFSTSIPALGITKRLRLQGFIVRDHYGIINQFLVDMTKWVKEGKIKWKETVFEGLENSSKAFIAIFNGENFGKTLVKIGPDL
jgi:hypothetical protein